LQGFTFVSPELNGRQIHIFDHLYGGMGKYNM
jgi:hypothetical protein